MVAAKGIRRRRRASTPSATGRVFGAWSEICDRLTEQGAVLADTLTAVEVAQQAARYVGAAASAAIADIAPIVGETTYAPYEPDLRMADAGLGARSEGTKPHPPRREPSRPAVGPGWIPAPCDLVSRRGDRPLSAADAGLVKR